MKLDKKVFDDQGYILIEDIIPSKVVSPTRRIAINLKRDKVSELGKPRKWGTGTYWRGIEMASKIEEELFFTYIHPFMQQIVPVFLGTKKIYLFNDQVVVKLPKEDFSFPEHYDNQYGPDPEGALNNEFKTINFMLVLTNTSKDFSDCSAFMRSSIKSVNSVYDVFITACGITSYSFCALVIPSLSVFRNQTLNFLGVPTILFKSFQNNSLDSFLKSCVKLSSFIF